MVPGFHKTQTPIQDIVSCYLGSLAVLCMLSSSNTGQVNFTGNQKVPCTCTVNDFIFQMALRNKSETLLLKCIIQISGQDHWHFFGLTGKCALTSAEVLLKDFWLPEWMWGVRRAAGGRTRVYRIPVHFLHRCLLPKTARSAAWGRSEVRAPQDGGFCSSAVQEHPPRFLLLLCKWDLVPAGSRPTPFPFSHEMVSRKAQSTQLEQQHGSIFAICFPLPAFHLWWPRPHLHEEILLFSKERGLLLWNWSDINQPVNGDFQNCYTGKLTVLIMRFCACLAYSGMWIPSSFLPSVTFRLLSCLLGPLNLCKDHFKMCQRAMKRFSSCSRFQDL